LWRSSSAEALLDLDDLLLGVGDDPGLLGGDLDVGDAYGDARFGRVVEPGLLDLVQYPGDDVGGVPLGYLLDYLCDLLLAHDAVLVGEVLRQGLVEDDPPDRGLAHLAVRAHLDHSLQVHRVELVGEHRLLRTGEHLALALGALLDRIQEVAAQHHVLGGSDDGLSVRR
jgi:hypothetical protein